MTYRRFGSALFVALSLVALGMSRLGGDPALAQANPCALLTVDDLQKLTPPKAHVAVAEGVPTLQGLGSIGGCHYTWGSGMDRENLDVVVSEASRMFAGMSPDSIKQAVQASARAGRADAVIPDVGDAAVFHADSRVYARTSAYLKGRVIQVNLDGIDAPDRKDQLIALLKTAASKL